MTILKIARSLPPAIAFGVVFLVTAFAWTMRSLFGTILGALVFTLLLYFSCSLWGSFKPLTPSQLALWIDELPIAAKTSVVASTITVVGFLVAFYAGAINWRNQEREKLKLAAAAEVESFVAELLPTANRLAIHAEELIETHKAIVKEGITKQTRFRFKYAFSRSSQFDADRKRVIAMSIEVHRFGGKYATLFASVWGATRIIEELGASVTRLAQASWINRPIGPEVDDLAMGFFADHFDAQKSRAFLEVHERESEFISALSGSLRGVLMHNIVGFNLASMHSLISSPRMAVHSIRIFRRGAK